MQTVVLFIYLFFYKRKLLF